MRHTLKIITLLCIMALSLLACRSEYEQPVITLATTTSTESSGLLDYLLPKFKQDANIEVRVIAVGTGKALRMGQDGDVDLVMVHAKNAELAFIDAGYGVNRKEFMYNDFIIVGPKDDPSKINELTNIKQVMLKLAHDKAKFISRGDDSGTHKKEQQLWLLAGTKANQENYREAGQGMGKTLLIADELNAYTMIDRGTWISSRANVELEILYEGDQILFNQYAAILVNPERYSGLNTNDAQKLIDWVVSEKGQQLIADYKIQDEKLFMPNAH